VEVRDQGLPSAVEALADERLGLREGKTAERDALADPRDLGEEPRRPLHLALAVRREQQGARAAELGGEKGEQQDGAFVRPVKVVEDEDDRLALGRAPQERRHAVEQPEARLRRVGTG
jgi:hypothetical protein